MQIFSLIGTSQSIATKVNPLGTSIARFREFQKLERN